MTVFGLVTRSLRFYARSHLGTILGAAVGTAVLTGALLVGDSVRGSLRQMALQRLGDVTHAVASGDRLFTEKLAAGADRRGTAGTSVALQLLGTAAAPDGASRANQVQVIGVTPDLFRDLGAPSNEVWLNTRLARHLEAKTGDMLLLRVPRASQISRDAPLSPEEDSSTALRLAVGRIVPDDQLGNFSLMASQVPPFNAFVSLDLLQARTGATNQANLLLFHSAGQYSAAHLQDSLNQAFDLPDAQLLLRPLTNSPGTELRTPRVFLDEATSAAALSASSGAQPLFTYFVNSLRHGTNTTPYSMVTAVSPGYIVPENLRDNEIIINQWIADDLGARVGDKLDLAYYVVGLMRELVEVTNSFTIRAVVPMEAPYADPSLMPDFPGLTSADNCRDWDTGFPINTDAIRDKDEAYWDKHRGTPKAFVTLAAGQKLWNNRFGNLTAVRYLNQTPEQVSAALKQKISPEMAGLLVLPVREQALVASNGATDFGQLFLGFSFFLIAAALILMSLLFRFALEHRRIELGTLLALGFTSKQTRRILLLEAIGLATIGSLIGVVGGIFYAKAMLWALSTIWKDAIASSTLSYFSSPITLFVGLAAGVVIASLTIWWTLRRESRHSARELLSQTSEALESAPDASAPRRNLALLVGFISILLALGLTGWGLTSLDNARADLFFSAGGLLLIGGIALASGLMRSLEKSDWAERLTMSGMGLRSVVRRRKRSRAVIGLLACGAFLIAAIGAFRLDATRDATQRPAGTGGFALVAETAHPVVQNLNAPAGREFYNLRQPIFTNVQFVPFRVLDGEDASCLNLNRAQRPRVLGVNPEQLHDRKAFTFAKTLKSIPARDWNLLEHDIGPGVLPAIGDAASIQYALGKKLGDDLLYTDEFGREFKIRLVGAVANSILQGNLVISEKHFLAHFPSQSGYRFFLLDAPAAVLGELRPALAKAFQDVGMEITPAADRLAAFNAVQNTYLNTFQVLGGLGLLLGTIGLGVVLLRNVYERRGELALLLAVGFRRNSLKWLVLSEHAALLVAGLLIGMAAAAVAVLPAFLRPGAELPTATLLPLLLGVFILGLASALFSTILALRGELLPALRNE